MPSSAATSTKARKPSSIAVNAWSKLDYPELTTLFFEFHGSESYVAEQVATVKELAAMNGGGEFRWSNLSEERSKLWQADYVQPKGAFPPISRMVGDQIGLTEEEKKIGEARTERAYRDGLWAPIS